MKKNVGSQKNDHNSHLYEYESQRWKIFLRIHAKHKIVFDKHIYKRYK